MTHSIGRTDAQAIRLAVTDCPIPKNRRLAWAVVSALGLVEGDRVHAKPDMAWLEKAVLCCGADWCIQPNTATIHIMYRPPENSLISAARRLRAPSRIVAFNLDRDMPLCDQSFDNVTAALFDQEAGIFARIIDGKPPRVQEYLHLEIGELSDAAVYTHAQIIASMRRTKSVAA